MVSRELALIFAPPALSAVAGMCAHFIWLEPTATVLAGAAGALSGVLFLPVRQGGPSQPAPPAAPPPPLPAEPAKPGAALTQVAGLELLQRLPLGVLLIDARCLVQFANPMVTELFGRCPPGIFHAAALRAPRLLAAIEGARAQGEGASVEFALMRGSEIHLRAHILPLPGPGARRGESPVVAVIEDVTQTRRTQALYRDFVANASHELRTPLSSIAGSIETLQGHAREDPEAAERFLGIMATQADRMRRLIDDMLSLSKIEQNERVPPREPQRLVDIVGETVEAMMPVALSEEITLSASLPERMQEMLVLGSREELAQVFQNLIENAIKYGRPGDTVRVEMVPGEPRRRGMIGVAVADTGPGIARTHLPRLTERFYRVSVPKSRARGGTGLGLAIVKHVLSRHRGNLEIESEVGVGSRFTVWLPLAPSAQPMREAVVG